MTRRRRFARNGLTAALLGAVLAGCGAPEAPPANAGGSRTARPAAITALPTASVAVAATLPASATSTPPTPAPSAVPTAVASTSVPQPIIGFDPKVGGPGTTVAVFGSGYTPGTAVVVRLGFPQPVGEALASAFVDTNGRWTASLVIPERLPSGEPITRGDMRLVAMNDQNVALAGAPFGFIRGVEPLDTTPAPLTSDEPAAPGPSRADASQKVRDLLDGWSQGNVPQASLAANLRAQAAAGRPFDQILGLHPIMLASFTVEEPQDRPAEVLFVPATLVYERFVEERLFTLVVEDGQWRINGAQLEATHELGH